MAGTALPGDPKAGARVFRSAGCGSCHTLAAAGTHGTVGPNLDKHFRHMKHMHPFRDIVRQVTDGGRKMPLFKGRLTAEQIQDVAA
jgi:cytochrome c6